MEQYSPLSQLQVSKTAQTGEYVGKGAFIVRGQRQWFRDLDVRLGGIIAINGVPLLMSGVPDMIRSICPRHATLSPGISKKDKLANRIYKNTGISTDEVLAVYLGHATYWRMMEFSPRQRSPLKKSD